MIFCQICEREKLREMMIRDGEQMKLLRKFYETQRDKEAGESIDELIYLVDLLHFIQVLGLLYFIINAWMMN